MIRAMMMALATGIAAQDQSRADQAADRLAAAKFAGWRMATEVIGPMLLPGGAEQEAEFPGLAAFVDQLKATEKALDFDGEPETFPGIDSDALVTTNPVFWRANYEVAPGDPAWMIVHASLLLADGEASRAQAILALARTRPGLPDPLKAAIDHLLAHCGRVIKSSNETIKAGIAKFDAGDRPGALADYEAAIKAWPQSGWAFYERGFTRMSDRVDAMKRAGETPETFEIHTPEVVDDFAESRRHDPFMIQAYQGSGAGVQDRFTAILRAVEEFRALAGNDAKAPPTVDALVALSDHLQAAEQDELALVVRQVAVGLRGGFRPVDHPFLTVSLKRLAPGEITQEVLDRLAGPGPLTLRSLVEPKAENR